MNKYEEKRQARIERLEEQAKKATNTASSLHNKAKTMASAIPFGQPILVGHHSEKRDRNYRKRIHSTFGKAFEANDKAEHYKDRAEAAKNNTAISSDDPEATKKLKAKIEKAERLQTTMKAANRIVRSKPKNERTPEKLEKLTAIDGISETSASGLFDPSTQQSPQLGDHPRRVAILPRRKPPPPGRQPQVVAYFVQCHICLS